MDDKVLIRLLRRDPDAGLRAAMQVYAPLVKGVLAHILPRDAREVEEGVADVFVALWRNAAALEQSGAPLRGWLAVTARNTGIDRYRALRRQGELSLDDGLAETLGELAEFERPGSEAGTSPRSWWPRWTRLTAKSFCANTICCSRSRKSPPHWG